MKTTRTLHDLDFTNELGEHPGIQLFELFIQSYKQLDDVDKAQHKLANSQLYINYLDAQKYGIEIYNVRSNGGTEPPIGLYSASTP
tara:strand:+ start:361 stop:618 length:258 start_codon:yes stop_codon:yes gene_type:complete